MSCIAFRAENRSNFFGDAIEQKAKMYERHTTNRDCLCKSELFNRTYAVAALSPLPIFGGRLNLLCCRPSETIFPLAKFMA